MKYLFDGSPVTSNIEALNSSTQSKIRSGHNEIYLSTVYDVYHKDNPKNLSKKSVEYRIRIESGAKRGQFYENARAVNLHGGVTNFSEIIFKPKRQLLKGSEDSERTEKEEHDASQVLVAFLDGSFNKPIIIGAWDNSHFTALVGKIEDGIRKIEEFNGLRIEINKDGEYILTYHGGQRDTKSKLTAQPNTAPTVMKIDKTGAWSISDKENQEIKIDRSARTITITQYAGTKPNETYGSTDSSSLGALINQVKFDKAAKKVTVTAGTTTATFDGIADTVKLETVAGGVMKITADKIGLGGSTAELVQQISDFLDKVLTWANDVGAVHTHLGNLGYPTGVPINAAAYIALGTDLTTIKGLVDGIKGGI